MNQCAIGSLQYTEADKVTTYVYQNFPDRQVVFFQDLVCWLVG